MPRGPLRAAALALWLAGAAAAAPAADASLYQALGAGPGVRALVERFVDRVVVHPRLAPFFRDTNRAQFATQLAAQVCQVAGGPCVYDGPSMAQAHESMDIGAADFHALVEVLQDAMADRGIAWSAQNRLLARLAPMHREIINRP